MRATWSEAFKVFLMLFAMAGCSGFAKSQTPTPQANNSTADSHSASEVLTKLDQLVEQNRQLEKHNRELMDEIVAYRQILTKQVGSGAGTADGEGAAPQGSPTVDESHTKPASNSVSSEEEPYKWGGYTPNLGYKIAKTDRGDLSISIYSYARYLNQLGLDATYKDAFGNVKSIQQRQDFQLQKVQIKFLGWIMDPKFRYFLYAWSSNASQGLGAQVVLAGNLNYTFNNTFSVGAGIRSLPGTRSVEGNFPFWLGVDTRLIADEFFRPSYTSGVWALGTNHGSAGLHHHDR